MSRQAEPAEAPPESEQEISNAERCVARQPILNQQGRLHAYELLFRETPAPPGIDAGDASIGRLVDDAVVFGMERFTNGFPALVACAPAALGGELVRILPPQLTILAIPETPDPSDELLDDCRSLKAKGFRLALDDYTGNVHPLLGLADYVRVDFSAMNLSGREQFRRWLGTSRVEMIAKRVATLEDYRTAAAEGFGLFQGEYLFKPAIVASHKVPANRLFHLEILQALYRDSIDLRRLSQLVMREASLTYRLLRLVNSPVCAVRQEVRSIESALILVGIDTFRKFATLAILGEAGGDQQTEILRMAYLRARFCELAAELARRNPGEQYLLGLFSMLPAMMRMPMEELAPSLPLREEIREALKGMPNRERCLLDWLERHESGDWETCDWIVRENRLQTHQLAHCYGEALAWAHEALRCTTGNHK